MEWLELFSFKGDIGCKQMWLTLIVTDILAWIARALLPVEEHKVSGNWGSFAYVTADNWAIFGAYYAVVLALTWILIATMVKRLHDRGHSGKWLAIFLGWFVAFAAISALIPKSGPLLPAGMIIAFIVGAPAIILGGWGFFELFLFPSKEEIAA